MSKKPTTGTAALEAEIEEQREHLARTVDRLAHKLDVKAQAHERVADLKDRATTPSGKPRPVLLMAGVGALAALSLLVWWRRR
jgi:Protein of unknown function (DUF3618)